MGGILPNYKLEKQRWTYSENINRVVEIKIPIIAHSFVNILNDL